MYQYFVLKALQEKYLVTRVGYKVSHSNELRRERLDLVLVSYGLLYQRTFVFDMTSLKHTHFKLSLDIFLMSVCQVLAEFLLIFVTHFRKKFMETAHCLFSYFYKSTMFCWHCECIQMKVDLLPFLMMYYSYLYDQKWSYR